MQSKPWLATYRENNIPEQVNSKAYPSVTHMMNEAMTRYADKPAFRAFGQTLTYAEIDRQSRNFAAWLQNKAGVRKGDRVAVMTPNIMAFPIAMIGIIRAGAVQVNVNPLYTPHELEHQLNDAGCETMVIYSGSTPTLAATKGKTAVKHVLTVGLGDGTPAALPSPPVDPGLAGTVAFADALREGESLTFTPVTLGSDDLLFLQYTGGTTGLSKGASLSHANLVANTEQYKLFMATTIRPGEEVVVTAIPLYHVFALMVNLITYFSLGAENWLVANPRDMDGFVGILKEARPTFFSGVNTLYAGLTQNKNIRDVDFSRLRLAVGGGAAVVQATSEKWREITGTFIREGYGLSETSPIVSFNPASEKDFNGTTGLPLSSTDIKLLDGDDKEVALGQSGEVCVKGPQVMSGYWNKPEANATAFTADGYFRTGDIGEFDKRGFLKIVDRKKDMVLVSGFNVFPNEVEAVATACPGVAECAAIGVPDERTGEAVRLFVVKAADAQLDEAQVIAFCRQSLAGYKVPKDVRFLAALPKSTVGKILRRELRTV